MATADPPRVFRLSFKNGSSYPHEIYTLNASNVVPGPDKKSDLNYAKERRNDFWCELECLEKHSFYDDLKLAY